MVTLDADAKKGYCPINKANCFKKYAKLAISIGNFIRKMELKTAPKYL